MNNRPEASWKETWTGTDQVRNYKLDGNRLSLTTAPSPDAFYRQDECPHPRLGEGKVGAHHLNLASDRATTAVAV